MITRKLSATKVRTAGTGMHGDGGLWLQVGKGRSWLFRFTLGGKAREMGLGALADAGRLAKAAA